MIRVGVSMQPVRKRRGDFDTGGGGGATLDGNKFGSNGKDGTVDVSVPETEGGELNRRDMTYVPMRLGVY